MARGFAEEHSQLCAMLCELALSKPQPCRNARLGFWKSVRFSDFENRSDFRNLKIGPIFRFWKSDRFSEFENRLWRFEYRTHSQNLKIGPIFGFWKSDRFSKSENRTDFQIFEKRIENRSDFQNPEKDLHFFCMRKRLYLLCMRRWLRYTSCEWGDHYTRSRHIHKTRINESVFGTGLYHPSGLYFGCSRRLQDPITPPGSILDGAAPGFPLRELQKLFCITF